LGLYGTSEGLAIESRVGRGKQQYNSKYYWVGRIRRPWTGRDRTGQGLGGSPQTKRAMGKICGKRTKAETEQLGVRVGEAGKEADGNRRGKGTKTKKEGRFLVGRKQTQRGHTESSRTTSRKLRKGQKGHPKEFAFARKQKKRKKKR
jgi:hypothetical protein